MIGAAALAVLVTSCAKKDEFVGSWQSTTPIDISSELPAAANGSATMSVIFGPDTMKGGDVTLTSLVEASQAVVPNPGVDEGYQTNVAATATVSGRWEYEHGDDDDLVLTLDMSTLKVDVDPTGVTFRQSREDGEQMPVTDSLTTATANMWNMQITHAMRIQFSRFGKLDDVKVGKDGMLKMELDNPDTHLTFMRAE